MTGNSTCSGSPTKTANGTPLTQSNDSSSKTRSNLVNSNQDSPNLKEDKNFRVVQDNPEEVNGTPAGTRLNEEMLEQYYRKSKQEKVYRRKYEEASYWVDGSIPNGVHPVEFREKMKDLQKENKTNFYT